MNQESEHLAIDIVSDVVCPWCYLDVEPAERPEEVYWIDPIHKSPQS
jgi:hypothetical protein